MNRFECILHTYYFEVDNYNIIKIVWRRKKKQQKQNIIRTDALEKKTKHMCSAHRNPLGNNDRERKTSNFIIAPLSLHYLLATCFCFKLI